MQNKSSRLLKAAIPWAFAGGVYFAWEKYERDKMLEELRMAQREENADFTESERRKWNKRINKEIDEKPEYRQK